MTRTPTVLLTNFEGEQIFINLKYLLSRFGGGSFFWKKHSSRNVVNENKTAWRYWNIKDIVLSKMRAAGCSYDFYFEDIWNILWKTERMKCENWFKSNYRKRKDDSVFCLQSKIQITYLRIFFMRHRIFISIVFKI